jgi:hypothetical protein
MTSQVLQGTPYVLVARRNSVSVVLPAYNEDENITKAIEDTVGIASRHCSGSDVIVVGDGSTDRTAEPSAPWTRYGTCIHAEQPRPRRVAGGRWSGYPARPAPRPISTRGHPSNPVATSEEAF